MPNVTSAYPGNLSTTEAEGIGLNQDALRQLQALASAESGMLGRRPQSRGFRGPKVGFGRAAVRPPGSSGGSGFTPTPIAPPPRDGHDPAAAMAAYVPPLKPIGLGPNSVPGMSIDWDKVPLAMRPASGSFQGDPNRPEAFGGALAQSEALSREPAPFSPFDLPVWMRGLR